MSPLWLIVAALLAFLWLAQMMANRWYRWNRENEPRGQHREIAGILQRTDRTALVDVAVYRGDSVTREQYTADTTTFMVWRRYPSGERVGLELEFQLSELAGAFQQRMANARDGS